MHDDCKMRNNNKNYDKTILMFLLEQKISRSYSVNYIRAANILCFVANVVNTYKQMNEDGREEDEKCKV